MESVSKCTVFRSDAGTQLGTSASLVLLIFSVNVLCRFEDQIRVRVQARSSGTELLAAQGVLWRQRVQRGRPDQLRERP